MEHWQELHELEPIEITLPAGVKAGGVDINHNLAVAFLLALGIAALKKRGYGVQTLQENHGEARP